MDYVKVTWLSGIVDIVNNVPVNQVLDITEGNNTLSVETTNLKDAFIFPNPVKDIINIGSNQLVQEVRIFNMLGQKLYSTKDLNNNEIDLSFLSDGYYFIEVNSAQNYSVYRFIKN